MVGLTFNVYVPASKPLGIVISPVCWFIEEVVKGEVGDS
jgi:hypothetical protein